MTFVGNTCHTSIMAAARLRQSCSVHAARLPSVHWCMCGTLTLDCGCRQSAMLGTTPVAEDSQVQSVLNSLRQLLQLRPDASTTAGATTALLHGLLDKTLADSAPPLPAILVVAGELRFSWG